MACIYIVLLLLPLVIYVLKKLRRTSRFFKERGVKQTGFMLSFFGNSLSAILHRKHLMEVLEDFNKSYSEDPMVGYYDFISPTLIVQNADYVERILIKDFSHFTDHGFAELSKKTGNIYDESLFTMQGNRWRAFRQKLSPLFTSGKLKSMYTTMAAYSERLNDFLRNKQHEEFDIKEAARLFSMDVNGSSFFGIDASVLKNPDSEYHRIGKKVMDVGIVDILRFLLVSFFPGFIVRLLGWSRSNKEVIHFFSKVVTDTFNYRRETNIQRNDMIQLLLQLKEKNKIEISSWDSNDDYLKSDETATAMDSIEITDEIITAQAFTLLVGGFDSLALAIMYTCFELSQHPLIQDKARSEVVAHVKSHSGLTYEALKSMTYLENVIKETLRVHPIVPNLMRCCTKDYTFPNGYTIRKGEKLQIPSLLIHNNPNYYNEPKSFKPERFEEATMPGTYLPFGDGPRICLAMRYALLHTKLGITSILMNYKLKLNSKTELPLKYAPASFFLVPTSEILFDLEAIAT